MKSTGTIYIHESHTIYVDNGELHLIYEENEIVFNMQTLFNDLPIIIDLCIKEQENNKKNILKEIGELIK